MWEVLGWIGAIAVVVAGFWVLLRLIKQSQAEDRSCSDKDSGWYNDGG